MMSASICLVLRRARGAGGGEGQGKGLDVGLARELAVRGPCLASWLPGTLGRQESEGRVCEENVTHAGDPVIQKELAQSERIGSHTCVLCPQSPPTECLPLAEVCTSSSVRPFPTPVSLLLSSRCTSHPSPSWWLDWTSTPAPACGKAFGGRTKLDAQLPVYWVNERGGAALLAGGRGGDFRLATGPALSPPSLCRLEHEPHHQWPWASRPVTQPHFCPQL